MLELTKFIDRLKFHNTNVGQKLEMVIFDQSDEGIFKNNLFEQRTRRSQQNFTNLPIFPRTDVRTLRYTKASFSRLLLIWSKISIF